MAAVCVITATATAPAEAAGPSAVTRAASGQLKVTTLPTRDGVKNLPGFSSGLLQAARDTAARLGARAPASSASTVRGAAAASPNVPGEPEDPAANDGAPLILGQGDGRGDSFGSGLGMSRGTLGCGARNTMGTCA